MSNTKSTIIDNYRYKLFGDQYHEVPPEVIINLESMHIPEGKLPWLMDHLSVVLRDDANLAAVVRDFMRKQLFTEQGINVIIEHLLAVVPQESYDWERTAAMILLGSLRLDFVKYPQVLTYFLKALEDTDEITVTEAVLGIKRGKMNEKQAELTANYLSHYLDYDSYNVQMALVLALRVLDREFE